MKFTMHYKAFLLPLCFLFISFIVKAQNTYTFTGNGNWTNTALWNVYPGTTINSYDSVIINGSVTINNTLTNNGTVINNNTLTNNGALINNGFLTNDGTLISNNTITNDFGGILDNNGTLTNALGGTLDNNGTLTNDGTLTNAGTLTNNNTLSGNNTSHTGNFSNAGILSPGNLPGTYTFNNNYTHQSTAILTTELESTTSFDVVAVTGTATLAGRLDVSLFNGFTPSLGDHFRILTAGTVNGTFNTVNLPEGYTCVVIYTATDVILEITATLNTTDFNESSFAMYPNPAKDQFTIQFRSATELESVTMYNLLGQAVLTSTERSINTSGLASGMYIVKVKTNTGKATKKLVID